MGRWRARVNLQVRDLGESKTLSPGCPFLCNPKNFFFLNDKIMTHGLMMVFLEPSLGHGHTALLCNTSGPGGVAMSSAFICIFNEITSPFVPNA